MNKHFKRLVKPKERRGEDGEPKVLSIRGNSLKKSKNPNPYVEINNAHEEASFVSFLSAV